MIKDDSMIWFNWMTECNFTWVNMIGMLTD